MKVTKKQLRDLRGFAECAINIQNNLTVEVLEEEIHFKFNITWALEIGGAGNILDSNSMEGLRKAIDGILGCKSGTMWLGLTKDMTFDLWARIV